MTNEKQLKDDAWRALKMLAELGRDPRGAAPMAWAVAEAMEIADRAARTRRLIAAGRIPATSRPAGLERRRTLFYMAPEQSTS